MPKDPSLPCGCPRNRGCWELGPRDQWHPQRPLRAGEGERGGNPNGSVPPTCPGGLESEGKDSPLPLEGLSFRLNKAQLPSWASSAGINIIKNMFSLPPGFTMCWERKNKSFILTRAKECCQKLPSRARKCPSTCRTGGLGPEGTRYRGWWGGGAGHRGRNRGVGQSLDSGVRSPDSPNKPCSGAVGRL